jgi:hypothetical protein
VRARPAASGNGAWLPARKLTLQLDGLPADGRVEVGQSLTLTLVEKAVGLPFESLPKPELPTLNGVDVYPDQSQDHTGDDGHWLEGMRARKFALVPQQAGTLTIPAITLEWWNVKTDRKEVARIPAHKLHVLATTGQTAARLPPAVTSSAGAPMPARTGSVAASPAAQTAIASPPRSSGHLLAWLALGLWLVTLLAAGGYAWYRRRHAAVPAAPAADKAGRSDRKRQHQAFVQTARTGDVAAQCESLMAWARCERPSLHHLGELAAALQPGVQTDVIAGLQRARYASAAERPDADTLVAAFDKGFAWRDTPATPVSGSALPPLYPQ